jgi:hypothetical protein
MTNALRAAAAFLAVASAAGGPVAAQSGALHARCAEEATPLTDAEFCNALATAVEIAQPRIGLAGAGGNPTLGTSSTIGMRIGRFPRIAIAPRVTIVHMELPPIEERSGPGVASLVPALGVDASVAVFPGIRLLPTVGGFGSIDLYGSLGRILLPSDQGFQNGATTWALGAQLGILRESFTAPGITLTGTYRGVTDITAGDADLEDSAGYFELNGMSGWGARGTIGKRFLLFTLTGGVGYDRYESDVRMRFADTLRGVVTTERDGFTSDRITAFGNIGFTVVIVSLVGEIGWQQGSEAFAGASDLVEKDGWYGGLALRLVL